jgi:hypothetical protein
MEQLPRKIKRKLFHMIVLLDEIEDLRDAYHTREVRPVAIQHTIDTLTDRVKEIRVEIRKLSS